MGSNILSRHEFTATKIQAKAPTKSIQLSAGAGFKCKRRIFGYFYKLITNSIIRRKRYSSEAGIGQYCKISWRNRQIQTALS